MEPTDTDKETRINELEARLAQQDHSILGLSDEVYQQQRHIARLEAEVRHLAERVQRAETQAPASDSTDEVPPHY